MELVVLQRLQGLYGNVPQGDDHDDHGHDNFVFVYRTSPNLHVRSTSHFIHGVRCAALLPLYLSNEAPTRRTHYCLQPEFSAAYILHVPLGTWPTASSTPKRKTLLLASPGSSSSALFRFHISVYTKP